MRTVRVGDVALAVRDEGSGPPVVLVHGFPELAYSWRHVQPALAAAGFRVLAPDMRGYGGSSCPTEPAAYGIEALTGDLVGLLDAHGYRRAVFVGHDWGATVVWQFALLHPDRVAGLCALSVPFTPRARRLPLEIWRERLADRFFYIRYFQDEGVADAELAKDPERTMRLVLGGLTVDALLGPDDGRGYLDRLAEPDRLPPWLSEADLRTYAEAFARTGFTGPLNWYRAIERNWAATPHLTGARITVPCLFVAGADDPALAVMPHAGQERHLDDLRGIVLLPGARHWIQQERPAEVTEAILGLLRSLGPWWT
ncbi:alpha/beta hydrolase [Pseudonocardia yuanmonensis]|uniref:Alpha/beta hydrolase n=1 Tax=Pseudonocardia yuanmonensis TaxID=1095914 RepID=A0ABP8WHZ3_9PSEU